MLVPDVIPKGFEAVDKSAMPVLVVRVQTDAGIEGIGHAITLMPEHPPAGGDGGGTGRPAGGHGPAPAGTDQRLISGQLAVRRRAEHRGLRAGSAVWDILGKDTGQPL